MFALVIADPEQPERALVAGIGLQRIFKQCARFTQDAMVGRRECERLRVFDCNRCVVRRLFVRTLERGQRLVGLVCRLISAAEQGPAFDVVRMTLEARDEDGDRLFHLRTAIVFCGSGLRLEIRRIERLRCADQSIQQQRRCRQQYRDQQKCGEGDARGARNGGARLASKRRAFLREFVRIDDPGGERFIECTLATRGCVGRGCAARMALQRHDDERERNGDHQGRQDHE